MNYSLAAGCFSDNIMSSIILLTRDLASSMRDQYMLMYTKICLPGKKTHTSVNANFAACETLAIKLEYLSHENISL